MRQGHGRSALKSVSSSDNWEYIGREDGRELIEHGPFMWSWVKDVSYKAGNSAGHDIPIDKGKQLSKKVFWP